MGKLSFYHIVRSIYLRIPVLFVFVMPAGHPYHSPVLILWTLLGTYFFFKEKHFEKRVLELSMPLIFYFMLTVLSNFLLFNGEDPFSEVEVKLSFVVLPILMSVYQQTDAESYRRMLRGFISGVFFWGWVQAIRGMFLSLYHWEVSYMFYTNFSFLIHPSYFAMYGCISLLILYYYDIFPADYKKLKYVYFICIVWFILLTSSKMGIFCLFLILSAFFYNQFGKKYSLWGRVAGMFLCILGGVGVIYFIEPVRSRFVNVLMEMSRRPDHASTESNAVRRLVWDASLKTLGKTSWYGVGVSNVKKALLKTYQEYGYTGAKEKNLNPHNQYLQSLLGLGWLGGLLLIAMHFQWLNYGIKNRKMFWFLVVVVIVFNFLVESMLQRAAGSVFFASMYMWLIWEHFTESA